MKIALMLEGKTERAFLVHLREFLEQHLAGNMPKLDPVPYDGRIPKGEKLKRHVMLLLSGPRAADHVIALTDVYTGSHPPDFRDAEEAKAKMKAWVGSEPRFHPHAAQYEFEAWLLPYWPTVQQLTGSNKNAPAGNPETVNHDHPPSFHPSEAFRSGKSKYIKARDASRILAVNNLYVAIHQCTELRSFINTILSLSGGKLIS